MMNRVLLILHKTTSIPSILLVCFLSELLAKRSLNVCICAGLLVSSFDTISFKPINRNKCLEHSVLYNQNGLIKIISSSNWVMSLINWQNHHLQYPRDEKQRIFKMSAHALAISAKCFLVFFWHNAHYRWLVYWLF
jgi:hypothetical protein